MADDLVPARSTATVSDGFRAAVQSAGSTLKERLQNKQHSAKKTYGFDLYEIQHYPDVLDSVFEYEELKERHSGGKLHKLDICVPTRTIKHAKEEIGRAEPFGGARKEVWLLALSVDDEETDKLGQSFSLGTRFNLVEDEIYISYKVE
ncbi:hypothetical protein MBLNU13_g09815t1 [Cladosporium sp. NU13]